VYETPPSSASLQITANYSGDFVQKAGSAQAGLTIKEFTTTSISASVNPSVSGQYLVFTASVMPAMSNGTVQFQVDGNNVGAPLALSGGKASWATNDLSVGMHVITAEYSGGYGSFSSTGIISQTVNRASVVTMLSSSNNPSVEGQSVAIAATINAEYPSSGDPTGEVTFYEDGTTIGTVSLSGRSATVDITPSGGLHTITATYLGDSNFTAGYSAQLMQSTRQQSTVTISSSANPSQPDKPLTLTATVLPSSQSNELPTGSIQFVIDGSGYGSPVQVVAGIASLETPLSQGNHTISATYMGDGNFLKSSSAVLVEAVSQPPDLTITSSQNPSYSGIPVSFAVTISGSTQAMAEPTGHVTFYDGSVVLGQDVVTGGMARYDAANLSAGSHQISAVYSGDYNFAPGVTDTLTQMVNQTHLFHKILQAWP